MTGFEGDGGDYKKTKEKIGQKKAKKDDKEAETDTGLKGCAGLEGQ